MINFTIPTYANSTLFVRTEYSANTKEEIDLAIKTYQGLNQKAKVIFEQSLSYDMEMLNFHKRYVDRNFVPTVFSRQFRSASAVDAMRILSIQLAELGLPSAVVYSLKAMGAGMVAAIADGPLPIGDILLAAATASVVVVVAANWDIVSPKFDRITRAFQVAFSETASNITSAFAKIKGDAKKESDKKKKNDKKQKKPTGNRVKDVHERLKKEGFQKTGQTGSHEKWKKGDKTVTVPNHGSNYEIPVGTLRTIWRQAGWLN